MAIEFGSRVVEPRSGDVGYVVSVSDNGPLSMSNGFSELVKAHTSRF